MLSRYDFVYLFDVSDGNPNGDPDAGNLPRVDPETGHGLVTDVCLKRKVRNYVSLARGNGKPQPGYDIYVRERAVLNQQHELAYKGTGIKLEKKKLPKKEEEARRITGFMCANFFDIRTFGAVMTTEVNCGQVRGPIQFTFARSVDPIVSLEHALTRCAVTTEREATDQGGDNRTMGRKFSVPYGLYRAHGFLNPHLAEQTGFGEADLAVLKEALDRMFEFDRSAARGEMAPRRCIAFRHESALGNARADQLFDRISVTRRGETNGPARSFADYEVTVESTDLPAGISIEEWI